MEASGAQDLLRAAAAARAAGDAEAARAGYVRAYDAARAADDVEAMTQAALGLAAGHMFGTLPGRVPAFLHEAYRRSTGVPRARVAAALARAWAYGGDPTRAVGFAAEALATAEEAGDPALLVEALDAELLVHWGPDDLAERLRITTRLQDAVAHIDDVEARLSAHLWRLTTALECLDLPAVQRQLRALDVLAVDADTPRVRFFAASRRGMYALLTGDTDAAEAALRTAVAEGTAAGEADTEAIRHTLYAGILRQRGDTAALAAEAAEYERYGTGEGVPSAVAEGAVLRLAAGEPTRARALLHQLAGADFAALPRDVDWLLTVTSLAEVAAATQEAELAATAARLLEPYAGRGVVNGGAVAFAGVVDDYLAQIAGGAWQARAAAAYQRLGATWWLRRVATVRADGAIHLYPGGDGVWTVGREAAACRDMKGLHYLRLLLRQPGTPYRAQDLSDAVAGHPGSGVTAGDTGALLDRQALAAYRQRLADLDEELAEAGDWADSERTARLEFERDALLEQLGAATGLAGRTRQPGSSGERARVAVRKAIAAAIARIEHLDPATGRLLRDTVTTGAECRYDPDPGRPARWVLDSTGR